MAAVTTAAFGLTDLVPAPGPATSQIPAPGAPDLAQDAAAVGDLLEAEFDALPGTHDEPASADNEELGVAEAAGTGSRSLAVKRVTLDPEATPDPDIGIGSTSSAKAPDMLSSSPRRTAIAGLPSPSEFIGRPTWVGKTLFAFALIFFMKMAESFVLPVVAAVALTFVLSGPVRRLRRLGVPEVLGSGIVLITVVCALGLLGSTLIGPATLWWERAPTTVTQLIASADRLRSAVPFLAPPPQRRVRTTDQTPAPDPLRDKIASESMSLTGALLGKTVSFMVSFASTFILLYFLLASEHWLLSRTIEAIPKRRTRARVVGGVRSAQREIGRFMATVGLINLGVGTATFGAMSIIGLPNPLLWGTVACVLNFIPYIGPFLIAGMLLIAGVLSFSEANMMLAPPLAFMVLHSIEANLVTPWVVGRRLSLSPLAVFLSVMFFGWLWGVPGALLAVPVLLAVRAVGKRNPNLRLFCIYLEGSRKDPPSLRSLLAIKRLRKPLKPRT